MPKDLGLACFCFAVLTISAVAQSVPQGSATSATGWRQETIRFSGGKAVSGLLSINNYWHPHCSNDGTVVFDPYANSASPDAISSFELLSVSPDGEAKHLPRLVPSLSDFNSIAIRDFFAGDHTLVTLLQASHSGTSTDKTAPRDIRYFLSLSDYSGDDAKLVPLDISFKPFKVAVLGSDDFLLFGWDEAKFLPVLAVVKTDGTIGRFLDLDDRGSAAGARKTDEAGKESGSAVKPESPLALLQNSSFVLFGDKVLLTYPGSAKPVLVLNAGGEERTIPIAFPEGFVLHDVLVSDGESPLVLRAQSAEDLARSAKAGANSKSQPRLFEFDLSHGSLLMEFVFDKPLRSTVACASSSTLSAIFYDTVSGASDQPGNESATQLMIASAPR